ncbi:MAG: c-type cytochrome [Planctomycetes bacterium]|nr:c-type cytochrome [Planctomycetota bacterium]
MRSTARLVGVGMVAVLTASLLGWRQDPAPGTAGTAAGGAPTAQQPRARGLIVRYESLDAETRKKEGAWSTRARLLALDVQRGESPTPMLSPGMFSATFTGILPMPARERCKFRIAGRGAVRLTVNGEKVLEGQLRPNKPIETAETVRLKKGDNDVVCVIESSAVGEAQLRVSWSSEMFAFEPVPPELWSSPADDAEVARSAALRHGQQLFVDRRCARCHQPQGPLGETAYGELDNPGPDLRSPGTRLQAAWIAAWLRDPRAIRPDAHMPKMRLTPQEIADLAVHLGGLGTPLGDPNLTAAEAETGAERFVQLGCIACHVPPNGDPADRAIGDRLPLHFVPQKWRPAALVEFLKDPRRDYPHIKMPDFKLSPDDARALAAFLLQDTVAALPAVQGDPANGKKLLQRHDCGACHTVDAPAKEQRHADLRNLHADRGCLAASAAAPDHALTADEVAALRAFVPVAETVTQRRSPLDFAARNVRAARCTSCHALDSEPSAWANVLDQGTEPRLPDRDPVAQGLPALTWVGAKLQPSWLAKFVTGKGSSPRPWLHARMPAFPQHGAAIVAGLIREQGYGPQDEPLEPPDANLVPAGSKLVKMGEGFNCVQCHGVGATPPVQVFERQGINFAIAAERLRKEYFLRWMMDPPRIDPDSRMPRFADAKGRTAFTDVFGGDGAQQFNAIWHWFRTLR